jgi:hypothetical protein
MNKTYQELKADAEIRKELAQVELLKSMNLPEGETKPSYNSIPGRRKWILKNGKWKKVLV